MLILAGAIAAQLGGPPALAVPGDLFLASTSDDGVKGNDVSDQASLSADGGSVAFFSNASNLNSSDTDAIADIYVKDVITGEIRLASTSDTGVKGSGGSFSPSLSADGSLVAFSSFAGTLDPGDIDTLPDVYVKDLVSGDTTLASTSDSGIKGNLHSDGPSVSADGAMVAFSSLATNLDSGDTDTLSDVYVKDLPGGDITLASTSDSGEKGNAGSSSASLSDDGTAVAFVSLAGNLDPGDPDISWDVYVKDLTTGVVTLASTSDSGVKGDDLSLGASLSANGDDVAFWSRSGNLDPGDTDAFADVYVKDILTEDLTLASTSDAGVKGNGESLAPSVSADGTKVAFWSFATNLDPRDTDGFPDVYVKDLASGDIELVSTSSAGIKGNATSVGASLSGLGDRVAFASNATNLDPGDTDGLLDVYVKEAGAVPIACTITGSPRDETLRGTIGDDVICGLGGNDRILGGIGNDLLIGGTGDDVLIGGPGDDILLGEAGRDTLRAQDGVQGNDMADGGSGRDRCTVDLGDQVSNCS